MNTISYKGYLLAKQAGESINAFISKTLDLRVAAML